MTADHIYGHCSNVCIHCGVTSEQVRVGDAGSACKAYQPDDFLSADKGELWESVKATAARK